VVVLCSSDGLAEQERRGVGIDDIPPPTKNNACRVVVVVVVKLVRWRQKRVTFKKASPQKFFLPFFVFIFQLEVNSLVWFPYESWNSE